MDRGCACRQHGRILNAFVNRFHRFAGQSQAVYDFFLDAGRNVLRKAVGERV